MISRIFLTHEDKMTSKVTLRLHYTKMQSSYLDHNQIILLTKARKYIIINENDILS